MVRLLHEVVYEASTFLKFSMYDGGYTEAACDLGGGFMQVYRYAPPTWKVKEYAL